MATAYRFQALLCQLCVHLDRHTTIDPAQPRLFAWRLAWASCEKRNRVGKNNTVVYIGPSGLQCHLFHSFVTKRSG